MAYRAVDRVQQLTTTSGTGNITLTTTPTGYQSFASRLAIGDTFHYVVTDGGNWEVGIGTYSAANTLNRTQILTSSNSNAVISLSGNTATVFVSPTAENTIISDAANLVTLPGNITTDQYYLGNGYYLTGIVTQDSAYGNANVAAFLPTYTGNLSAGNITTTGNVATQNITAATILTSGNVTVLGNVSAVAYTGNIRNTTGGYSNANVTVFLPTYTGNLSASSDIIALYANAAAQSNAIANLEAAQYSNANVANYLPTYTGALPALTGNVTTTANVTANNVLGNIYATGANYSTGLLGGVVYVDEFTGQLTTSANLVSFYYRPVINQLVVGNVLGVDTVRGEIVLAEANLYFGAEVSTPNSVLRGISGAATTFQVWANTGRVIATGNITGSYFLGNGYYLTGIQYSNIAGAYSNANVANYLPVYGGAITASAGDFTAAVSVAGNITSNAYIQAVGNISASYYLGNGALLTGLYSNANVANYLPTYTGNISANYYTGNGALLTGLYSNANVANYLPTYTGNISANYYTGNIRFTTGGYGNANVTAVLQSYTGNITAGNITVSGTTNSNVYIGNTIDVRGSILSAGQIRGNTLWSNNEAFVAGNFSVGGAGSFAGDVYVLGNLTFGATPNINVAASLLDLGSNGTPINPVFPYRDSGLILHQPGNGVVDTLQFIGWENGSEQFQLARAVTVSGPVVTVQQYGNVRAFDFIGNTFYGNVVAPELRSQGNVTASDTVVANAYTWGNGASIIYGNSNVAQYLPTYTGNISAGNITVSNNVVITGNLTVQGNTTTVNANSLTINDKDIVVANNAATADQANGAGLLVGATGQYASMIWRSAGNLWDFSGNIAGDVGYLDYLEVVANITNLGNTNVTGNVTASYVLGNGAFLTGLPAPYSNANVANYLQVLSSNVTTTANISANYFLGNGAFLTGLPESYSNANVANYLSTYTGNISANYYTGNGALLTGLYSNANVANYLPTYTGNISANYYTGNGALLTGINANYSNANVANYLPTYTGNIQFGNLRATSNPTNEIRITQGTLPEFGTVITSNGVYVGSGVPFGNLAAASIRLEVGGGNVYASNFIATDNVTANAFIGNGAALTNIAASGLNGYMQYNNTNVIAGTNAIRIISGQTQTLSRVNLGVSVSGANSGYAFTGLAYGNVNGTNYYFLGAANLAYIAATADQQVIYRTTDFQTFEDITISSVLRGPYRIRYLNGQMIVCYGASSGMSYYSTGNTWINNNLLGSGNGWQDVTYNGSNTYAALWRAPSNQSTIYYYNNSNGAQFSGSVTWTATNILNNNNKLTGVAWGGNRFVAVGGNGTVFYSNTSTGTGYTSATSNTSSNLNAVIYANDRYVAVGNSGAVITSADAVNWVVQSSNTTGNLTDVTYNSDTGLTIAVMANSTRHIYSYDSGLSWSVSDLTTANTGAYSVLQTADGIIIGGQSVVGTTYTPNVFLLTQYSEYARTDTTGFRIYGGASGQFLQTDGNGNITWATTAEGITAVPSMHFDVSSNANNQSFNNAYIASYSSNTQTSVYRNGVLVAPEYYTISGSTLTINLPLLVGDNIDIGASGANGSIPNTAVAAGSNTQIQYNNAGVIGGSDAFTFDRSSNTVTATGNITAGNVTATGGVFATNIGAVAQWVGSGNTIGTTGANIVFTVQDTGNSFGNTGITHTNGVFRYAGANGAVFLATYNARMGSNVNGADFNLWMQKNSNPGGNLSYVYGQMGVLNSANFRPVFNGTGTFVMNNNDYVTFNGFNLGNSSPGFEFVNIQFTRLR